MLAKFFLLFLFLGEAHAQVEYATAKVLSVQEISKTEKLTLQEAELKILNGHFKGKIIKAKNYLWDDENYNTLLSPDRKIIVRIEESGETLSSRIVGYRRSQVLLIFFIIFCAFLFLTLGKRSFNVFASIIFNLLLFVFAALPLLQSGKNPIFVFAGFSTVSVLLTLFTICGISKKAFAAAAGTLASIFLATAGAIFFHKAASITGEYFEDSRFLLTATRAKGIVLNFPLLATSAVAISALGMAVDVAITISSFIDEFSSQKPSPASVLVKSGINVGADVISTMLNSLVFVFVGEAAAFMMNCFLLEMPLKVFLNYEEVAALFIDSFLASSVLVFTIPITSLVAGKLYGTQMK